MLLLFPLLLAVDCCLVLVVCGLLFVVFDMLVGFVVIVVFGFVVVDDDVVVVGGCWLLAVGCWLLNDGCWLLAVGCWSLAVGACCCCCCCCCCLGNTAAANVVVAVALSSALVGVVVHGSNARSLCRFSAEKGIAAIGIAARCNRNTQDCKYSHCLCISRSKHVVHGEAFRGYFVAVSVETKNLTQNFFNSRP